MAATCAKLPYIAARGCLVLRYSPGVLQCSASRMAFSTSSTQEAEKKYKLVILGGGTGGSAIANKFAKKLGKNQVAVVEPSETHYNQALFTLVGGGIKKFESSHCPTASVLPGSCDWIQQSVTEFDPDNNSVTIDNGDTLKYDYLIVALGVQLDYKKIKGAVEALESDPRVCSNYHPKYVLKTVSASKSFTGGNAIFTLPDGPIKCAGAPQKIAYLLEELFSNNGTRAKTHMVYNTALPFMFAVPKYAKQLAKVALKKNIEVNFRYNLVEVRQDTSEAVFELLDAPDKSVTYKYDLLHISPPCSAPDTLKNSVLVDKAGYLNVHRGSLQHVSYNNIFGIGDCTNLPTSKTAAAVAGQVGIASNNLRRMMDGNGKDMDESYSGYTSCPLVVSSNKVIMAEFGYDLKDMETFPIDQSIPRRTMFWVKTHIIPQVYWRGLVRGFWHGPKTLRKILHLGTK